VLNIHKISTDLDKTFAVLGLTLTLSLASYLFFSSGRLAYIVAALIGFAGCLFYLAIRKRLPKSSLPSLASSVKIKPSTYLMLNILFFVLFSYSILSIYLSPEPYIRPLSYFIAIVLMAGLLGVEILFLPARKSATVIVLLKIMMLALSLRWSQLLIFPSGVLSDPIAHEWFTTQIVNTGHILEGLGYSKLPNMHLMIGATSIVTDLNYKMSTMLSITLLQVICDLSFVFLIGKFIWNAKAGLLGALLLAVANHHINLGVAAIPTTAGAVLVAIIVYLLFRYHRNKSVATQSVVLLFFLVLILTHTVSALCMSMVLFVFWSGCLVYNRLYREEPVPVATLALFASFSVGMVAWWTYASGHILSIAEAIRWGYTLDWSGEPTIIQEATKYIETVPFSGELTRHIGLLLFSVFGILGCFYLLAGRVRNRSRFVLAVSAPIVLLMGFAPWEYQVGILHRWWFLGQILLAVPFGIFLLALCEIFSSKIVKGLLLLAVVLPLCFLLIMSPVANYDNDTLSGQMAVRYMLTESELQAMNTVPLICRGTLASDGLCGDKFSTTPAPSEIGRQIRTRDFSDLKDAMVIIREEAVNHPRCYDAYRLKYSPYEALEAQGFSCVYDCGSVKSFLDLDGEVVAR